MDSDSIRQIIIIIILICLSAFFSATETSFSSMNKARIKTMAQEGNRRAALALKMADNFDRFLSTTLIGNNIVNICASTIATVFFIKICANASKGTTVATIVMTAALLIFGEISPKSIAKDRPEKFAMAVAPVVNVLMIILTPINWLFFLWKKLLSKIFKSEGDRGITEEELITIVEEAESEGGIDAEESELIRSAIEFGDLEAKDILTPRVDVVAVRMGSSRDEIEEIFSESEYSRLPVYDENIDNIIGLINQKDFYNPENEDKSVSELVSPAVFVVPSMKISKILAILKKSKSHMAVVTDEFGGTEGIVTMEDILEELVGEIWDEHDEIIEEFEKLGENEYRILCSANIDKMFELFELNIEVEAPTVGGWVIEELGKIPKVGDEFTYENLYVRVTKSDPRRVLEVKVSLLDEQKDDD
ncbi:MAG: HlyC/CorC family transporter [Oscillospiraceae bacterium]|nr:HlyC/CorC family transporter [Oscillospiraceae bacterium]